MRRIVIIGAGGHARDVLDVFEACNARAPEFDVLGFVVEPAWFTPGAIVNGRPVLGPLEWLADHPDVELVCAVGDPALRRRLSLRAMALGARRFASVVHPAAAVARRVTVSEGCVVGAGVVMTSLVRLAPHSQVNIGCTLAHDVAVGEWATVAPGVRLSGNVTVEEGANVGTGATVIEKLTVGRWSVVGAGATVVRDVPANSTAVGVPARVTKQRADGWHL